MKSPRGKWSSPVITDRAAAVAGGTSGLRVVRLHGHPDHKYPDVRGPDAELGNFFRSHGLHLSRACRIFRGGRLCLGHTQLEPSPADGRSVIGGAASFILAYLVGSLTLRLRGMYFTMFTFGLVELVRNSLHWWEVNITGTVGRLIISADNTTVFYAMVATFLAVLLASYLIKRSRFGLALRSIGESEEAAAHSGVNVNRVKVVIFAVSAFFMGATGATMSMRWTYIDPTSAFSIQYLFHACPHGDIRRDGTPLRSHHRGDHFLPAGRDPDNEISLLLHAPFRTHDAGRYPVHALRAGGGD